MAVQGCGFSADFYGLRDAADGLGVVRSAQGYTHVTVHTSERKGDSDWIQVCVAQAGGILPSMTHGEGDSVEVRR